MKEYNYPKFSKSQRSTFKYWFWHWLAFNRTAKEWGVWKFHHIFHDIEKPFLRLILPYEKVQMIHRTNNKHHLEYKHPEHRNWTDMVIDWECSSLTKEACPYNAIEEANIKLESGGMSYEDYQKFVSVWSTMCQNKNKRTNK